MRKYTFLILLVVFVVFVAWTQRPTQPAFPTLTEPPSQTPHVEPEQELPPVEPEQELPIGYVTAASLNVRNGPSTDYEAIGFLYQCDSVTVLDKHDEWWIEIDSSGDNSVSAVSFVGVGYVSSRYITYTKSECNRGSSEEGELPVPSVSPTETSEPTPTIEVAEGGEETGTVVRVVDGDTIETSEGLATPSTYTVQSGDTLTRIAARFGTSVAAILSVNELANPNLLHLGQTLVLPSGSVPTPQQPQVQALATRIYGTPEFVAAVEATLSWLAENDLDALARVDDHVDTISIETRPGYKGRAYSTNNGWCETTTILADLMEMLLIVVHEASHCYQSATQGLRGSKASREAFAYGEQIDFMRRHGYHAQHIAFLEQRRAHWAAQAGLN